MFGAFDSTSIHRIPLHISGAFLAAAVHAAPLPTAWLGEGVLLYVGSRADRSNPAHYPRMLGCRTTECQITVLGFPQRAGQQQDKPEACFARRWPTVATGPEFGSYPAPSLPA